MLLQRDQSVCLIVDVQEKVCPVMQDPRRVIYNSSRLLRGAEALAVPIVVTEQNPRRLGETVADLRPYLPAGSVVDKMSFPATGEAAFCEKMAALGRKQVVLAGIEAHVCVLQTALGLLERGYHVFLVEDACSSRKITDQDAAYRRLQAVGGHVVTTEMVLFEWLHRADDPQFRRLLEDLIR